jgi:hypothetical protein
MEVSHAVLLDSINEIKILSNVRLINRVSIGSIDSKDNLHVQFGLSGDVRGAITCYLCLDGHELTSTDKNVIFPMFVEAMNILIGKQVSQDQKFKTSIIKLSPPKLSMIPRGINSALKSGIQRYQLELDQHSFTIITEYSIEALS